jgi:hypothetical protein
LNKDRRKFLKAFGLIGAGLMLGLPDVSFADDIESAPVKASFATAPRPRFYSPRGGCTEANFALLDKGPISDRHFALY